MVLDWFNTYEVVSFAEEIAEDVKKLRPTDGAGGKLVVGKREQKEQKKLDALIVRVHVFAKKHPLNIYKKAKFLNVIKWQLKDAGEDAAYIDEIIGLMTAALNA